MKPLYQIKTQPEAEKSNVIQLEKLRITFLTSALVRLEWSEKETFTDLPTQVVLFRAFKSVSFLRQDLKEEICLETDKLSIHYKKADNLRDALFITMKNPVANWNVITGLNDRWRYGDDVNALPGTARTLDNADGDVPLEKGIISQDGFSILDDSKSCLIKNDGSIVPRSEKTSIDIYFFGYGHNYKSCLFDYFQLTGNPPLLPRWALGNWWSRYHRYTEQEYISLMETFSREKIPLSVAMIDMDWHVTQIEKSIGSGWTGYSWNKELFPNPKRFLSELHKKGLKVSLNVHPAEGVGRHENAYKEMAKAMQLKDDGKTIPFDIANPNFVQAYFENLHAPLEKEGVDFWWVDWQQGKESSVEGLDPLWLLNHYHYLDNAKSGRRSLILSRYCGSGSQRYPVGFSGDTIISWKSLAFQPYFTASAANIGYGWWSHDIGGHMMGTYDEELQVRWVQLGVFSPIMRLHSSSSRFNHKEPWKYEATKANIVKKMLILRHQLIPYLYTMNWRFYERKLPLVLPLYYEYPEEKEAYSKGNEYFFGSELLCAPITNKEFSDLKLASIEIWLPDGIWTDIFTGLVYSGGRSLSMYRPLDNFPILLKEGGILPLAAKSSVEKSELYPQELDLYIATSNREINNSFVLYEDDGESFSYHDGKYAKTEFIFEGGKKRKLKICPANDKFNILPEKRTYNLHFFNSDEPSFVYVKENGKEREADFEYQPLLRKLCLKIEVSSSQEVEIYFEDGKRNNQIRIERSAAILDKAQIDFSRKEKIFQIIEKYEANPLRVCQQLLMIKEEEKIIEALLEILENN